MFKPTQALCRRFRKLRLTTKDVNKGFYKGTGTGRMGTHDKWGGFKVDYSLVRTYVVPKDLATFKVRFWFALNALLLRICGGMCADAGGIAYSLRNEKRPHRVWNAVVYQIRPPGTQESEVVFGQVEARKWPGLRCYVMN